MVYHEVSHKSLVFSRYTHKPLGECVYQENSSYLWDIPWYTTRKCCITILYHAIENRVGSTINVTYVQRTMGRLGVIPSNIQRLSFIMIGCIFYNVV